MFQISFQQHKYAELDEKDNELFNSTAPVFTTRDQTTKMLHQGEVANSAHLTEPCHGLDLKDLKVSPMTSPDRTSSKREVLEQQQVIIENDEEPSGLEVNQNKTSELVSSRINPKAPGSDRFILNFPDQTGLEELGDSPFSATNKALLSQRCLLRRGDREGEDKSYSWKQHYLGNEAKDLMNFRAFDVTEQPLRRADSENLRLVLENISCVSPSGLLDNETQDHSPKVPMKLSSFGPNRSQNIQENNQRNHTGNQERTRNTQSVNTSQTHVININTQDTSNPHIVVQESRTWHSAENLGIYSKLEAKLYMVRMTALLVAGNIFILFLLLMVNNFSTQNLYVVTYLYLIYFSVENIVRICYMQREPWRETEDFYSVFDALSGILLIGFIELKILKIISVSMIGFVPFMATTFGYHMTSKAPSAVKSLKILIRCFYTIQSLIITAKLDKVFDWHWAIILAMVWVVLAILGGYFFSQAFTFSIQILKDFSRNRQSRNMEFSLRWAGVLWYLLLSGLIFTVIIYLWGCVQIYEDSRDFSSMKDITSIGLYFNTFAVFYTLMAFKPLTYFVANLNPASGPEENAIGNLNPKQKKINLEIQKKESYFVMLSSTYFLPLKNGLSARKEKNLQRVKTMLDRMKFWRSKSQRNLKKRAPQTDIQTLKQDKETLDEKFNRLEDLNKMEITKKIIKVRKERTSTGNLQNYTGCHMKEREISGHNLESLDSNSRHHISADEIQLKKMLMSPKPENTLMNEENLCYLCFDNPPNAVLMKCGHGGICYDCASALVQKKNECMECRSPVDMIYKVDPSPKMSDIIKAVEICKVNMS